MLERTTTPCDCPMFQREGKCYHRGYRPQFRHKAAHTDEVPRAVKRMKRWVNEVERNQSGNPSR